MTAATPARPGFAWGFTLLLVLAVMVYAVMAQSAAGSRSSDAAGNGLAQAFGIVAAVLLWLVLAGLLLIARRHGAIPGWALACLVVLLPFALLGVALSIALWSERGGWLIWPALAAPLLLILYATWARFAGSRGAVPVPVVNGLMVAVLALATVAPFL